MLNILYIVDIDIGIVVTIIVVLCDIVAIKKKKKNYFRIALFSSILLFAFSSVLIHIFYTKTPDLLNFTLDEAHHTLSESDLFLDDAAEQISMDNLGSSNLRVQTQEPKSGEIVRKNSVVTVTIKEIPDSPETTDTPPAQEPNDTYTSPISIPTQGITDPKPPTQSTPQPTPKPTSTPTPKPTQNSNSTSNGSTGTESGTGNGDYQPVEPPISDYNTKNPNLDPTMTGNADAVAGVNVGEGAFQPQDPSINDYPEQGVISGTIPEPS